MPEPTFLQIQGQGDSTMRMIELPAGPVRIGRGAHCEVRLGDPGLGDVQCMLRRRGATWHYQPVGPSGQVWFDGRGADQQRPIPLGVPFRVGEHWLVLRPADSAVNDWGTFDAPIPVEADPEPEPEGRPMDSSIAEEPVAGPSRSRPAPPTDEGAERLRRWEARLEQRERWLKDRQEEHRWEARWKSAGESIRSRATPPATKPASPTPKPTSPPPTSTPTTVSAPRMPERPSQTPPVARIIEPKGSEPIRRVADPTPRPPSPRVVARHLPDPPASIRRPPPSPSHPRVVARSVEPAREARPPATPEPTEAPPSRALVTLEKAPAARSIPAEPGPGAPTEPIATLEISAPDPEIIGLAEPVEVDRPGPEPVAGASAGGSTGVDFDAVDGLSAEPCPARLEARSTDGLGDATHPEFTSWASGKAPPAIEAARRSDIAQIAAESSPIGPEVDRPARAGRLAVESPREVGPSRAEWPSARTIFEAQGRRASPTPVASKPARSRSREPEPTEVRGPASWSMPLWLGWFPVLVASLMLGGGGVVLAYEWAIEANNANFAIRMASRPEGSPGSAIDPALIPRGGWWTSTATHQAAWALALARAGDGEDHSEDVRSLLNSSRDVSRLASRSRFVVEWPESTEPGSPHDLSHLGRTRDVVTLAWTGRRLRKAGKLDPAIRAYRSAMEIASKASLEDLDPPTFNEDPQVRRYALPREALIGLAAKMMAEDGEWTREQWDQALPPSAGASMVASRVLAGMRKWAEADRLADLAIRQAESPTPPGYDPAEDLAAGAEALAYRRRWTDAAGCYRRAIDQAEDDATRRRWWLNFAEVAQRAGDDAGRSRAIEAAKSDSSVDEITRRALKYQRGLTGLASSGGRP